ncbi:MAG TPA: site-specific integrase [Candidatus Hydrogenedentes bacterium]|nr:site-specific integrase [Candidatus Hydrogenedentota bacterium]
MANIETRTDSKGDVSYRVKVRLRGHAPVSKTFDRLTDAKIWAVQTEADIRSGRNFKNPESRKRTFAEMIDRYVKNILPGKRERSQKAQRKHFAYWRERFGDYFIADVTPNMIAEAKDDLLQDIALSTKRQRTPSTVTRYLAALSHCYTVAVNEWQWADENPVKRIRKPKEPKGRVRYLSDEERERLLKECRESRDPALLTIVTLGICSGMRRGEIMDLTWNNVDLNRAVITIEDTKNGERRGVPVVEPALSLMREHARIRRRVDTPLVFPAPKRAGANAKPLDFESAWKAALARAEITDFKFHDLRHSCASYLAMNGASVAEIAGVLGHKTWAMTKRYSHLSQEHTSKVLQNMAAKVFAKPEAKEGT